MKKHITIAALLAAGTAFADADVLYVNFGQNDGHEFTSFDNGGATWNQASSANYGESGETEQTWGELKWSDGTNSGISLWTQGSTGGDDAKANSITGASDAMGVWNDADVWAGCLHGDASNATMIRLSGLEANGTYTFEVVLGSGSNWKQGSSDCSMTAGTVTSASVVAQNGNDGASFDGDYAITILRQGAGNTATSWAILSFDVTATADGVIEFTAAPSASGGGIGDIAGFSLTSTAIPEPSAFGLLSGLGALALVASRRRRK